MKPYGYSRRLLDEPVMRVCPYCCTSFTTRDPIQKKCKAKACSRAYDLERQHQHRDLLRSTAHHEGLAAPALKASCEALEAQLTPETEAQWPQIIARFTWHRTPGYRDLAHLTRACVAAKVRVKLLDSERKVRKVLR